MDSSSEALLPGQSPPLSVITPTDHSGIVLIVTILGIIFALISIIIRVYIRLQRRNAFARDDVAATIAMVSICIWNICYFKLELTITRYSPSYNLVLSLLELPMAMARPSKASQRAASYRCKRWVHRGKSNSATWSYTFRRYTRAIFYMSSPSASQNPPSACCCFDCRRTRDIISCRN